MKSALALLVLLMALPAFSQGSGKIKKYGIVSSKTVVEDSLGKQRPESIEKYDAKGRLVYIEKYSKKGVLKEKAEYRYAKNGLLTEEITYDEKGLKETVQIEYDMELPVRHNYFDADGKRSRTMESKYNGFEEKIQETLFGEGGQLLQTTRFEYDNKGLKTKKITTDASGKVIETKIYTYEFE